MSDIDNEPFHDLGKLEMALAQRDALRQALEKIEAKAYSGDWTLPSSFGGCARAMLDTVYGSNRQR